MGFADLVAAADRAVQDKLGGEPVFYQPEAGAAAVAVGVFDEVYILAKGDPEAGVETVGPAVFFRLEDLPTNPEDDEPILTIRTVTYRVIERRPDGLGGVLLVLRKTG